jgi:hypothetical protein
MFTMLEPAGDDLGGIPGTSLSRRWPVLRLIRIFGWRQVLAGGRGWPSGPVTGPGVGQAGRQAALQRLQKALPVVLAVPSFGQLQGDVAAAVAGDAGGDADQLAADGAP